MERTGMQARDKELLKKTIDNLREYNQTQARIIREKNKKIKELIAENTALSYQLRVITNKYNMILKDDKNGNN